MELNVFKTIYLIGLVPLAIIRTYYRLLSRGAPVAVDRRTIGEIAVMLQAAVGMLVIPLLFVFSSVLDFADYELPAWTAWAGAAVLASGIWLLWRSHAGLRQNFSSTLQLKQEHELITGGVYARIRHPMYAALWLLAIANTLLLHNWIAGWSYVVCFGLLYFVRVPREERMMLDRFGESYRRYVARTGRVMPRMTHGSGG